MPCRDIWKVKDCGLVSRYQHSGISGPFPYLIISSTFFVSLKFGPDQLWSLVQCSFCWFSWFDYNSSCLQNCMVIFPTQVFMCPLFLAMKIRSGNTLPYSGYVCSWYLLFWLFTVHGLFCCFGQLPNSRLENLEGTIFTWLFVCLFVCRHTFDILVLPWPLKMLSFNFCNIMDLTGLDLTTDFQCSSRSEIGQQLFLKSSVRADFS